MLGVFSCTMKGTNLAGDIFKLRCAASVLLNVECHFKQVENFFCNEIVVVEDSSKPSPQKRADEIKETVVLCKRSKLEV